MSRAVPTLELVTIGDELLLGETVDGNAAWLGRVFAAAGIRIARKSTVGDDAAAIRDTVAAALQRTGAVICTGGLGPTQDDLTRPAVAELFGYPLRLDEGVLEQIRARFTARGLVMSERNRIQAEVPEGAVVLPNAHGTAPGLALYGPAGQLAILLPGVPAEMRALVEEQVLPLLRARWPALHAPIRHRVLRTTGIPESALADAIDDLLPGLAPLTVAFLPSYVGVDLRVTSWGVIAEDQVDAALDRAEARLRERIGAYVFGTGAEDLAGVVSGELVRQGLRLALAESCTGGLIAKRLTDPAGASAFLSGGVVAYANEAKEALLGVAPELIRAHGAVSEEVARAMAAGARYAFGTEAALAVTGIAGPCGGTEEKPVGTVWIAAALDGRVEVRRHHFIGGREEVRERAAQTALALLWRLLREVDSA